MLINVLLKNNQCFIYNCNDINNIIYNCNVNNLEQFIVNYKSYIQKYILNNINITLKHSYICILKKN